MSVRILLLKIVFTLTIAAFSGCSQMSAQAPSVPGDVVFGGGFETDPRDGGRPVALIAAALNVESEVFRQAFSNVNPAKNGPPSHSRVQDNKKVLLAALSKHGVTNDRLDEVSNYYRYRPQAGELWTHRPAKAKVVIKDGKVVGFEIVDAGSGYLTEPTIAVVGHPNVRAIAKIEFTKELKTNGRIVSIVVE
ncbi:MAG: hypothetical protein ACI9HK_001602, partial [Pirellulaceae bacterium]